MQWNSAHLRLLVRQALHEDAARQDVTTQTLIDPDLRATAEIRSNQAGVVCGLPLCVALFRALDPACSFAVKVAEGGRVGSHALLGVVQGNARAILSAERP